MLRIRAFKDALACNGSGVFKGVFSSSGYLSWGFKGEALHWLKFLVLGTKLLGDFLW